MAGTCPQVPGHRGAVAGQVDQVPVVGGTGLGLASAAPLRPVGGVLQVGSASSCPQGNPFSNQRVPYHVVVFAEVVADPGQRPSSAVQPVHLLGFVSSHQGGGGLAGLVFGEQLSDNLRATAGFGALWSPPRHALP
jgi:hypothetical protein